MPNIIVKVRGTKNDEIFGPEVDKQEAEQQLARIREKIGTGHTVDVPWLAVQGKDIISAHINEGISDVS